VVLFVGVLDAAHHFKGLGILLDALEPLGHMDWHLVAVGGGPLQAQFEAAVVARQLSGRVHFAGNVHHDALPRYYRLADVHVLPSTGRGEAFGLVVLEAAASAVPTIASALPGVRTVVLDGRTGTHVPPDDPAALRQALRVLLEQPDVRRRLGLAARARAVTDFSWEPLIGRLQRTYEAVVAARRSSSRSGSDSRSAAVPPPPQGKL
jgi:glycosyltransferase involved in cell wall biosynthesis